MQISILIWQLAVPHVPEKRLLKNKIYSDVFAGLTWVSTILQHTYIRNKDYEPQNNY